MSASNAFVEGFADFWKAPSPDRLTDHLHPDVVLVRPLSPPRHGLGAAQREFTRILGLLPDLHGEVDRWSQAGDVVFIEFRLMHGSAARSSSGQSSIGSCCVATRP